MNMSMRGAGGVVTAASQASFLEPTESDPIIREIDLFRHVMTTGGTGCGKTLSVVLPLLERCVQHSAGGRPAAVFVCDVKGDLSEPLREIARNAGRSDDVVEISPGSGVTTDILEVLNADPLAGAALLYRAAVSDSKGSYGSDNAYWEMGAIEYLASALAWIALLGLPLRGSTLRLLLGIQGSASLKLGGRRLGVTDLARFIREVREGGDAPSRQLADQLEGLISLAELDPKTRGIFQSIFVQVTGRLTHPLVDSFCSGKPNTPLESWLKEGRIFLVRLPFDTQPMQANFLTRLLKMALFKRVLSQSPAALRSSFFVIDEAHRFVTGDEESGDHNFIDRSRAFRSGCIYATQSLNPMKSILEGARFESFMANVNTRLFGRTLDQPTSIVAAEMLGDVDLIRGYEGVQRVLVPDPDPDEAPQPTFDHSVYGLRLNTVDLARLQPGEFYVAITDVRAFHRFPPWRGRPNLSPRTIEMKSGFRTPIERLRATGAVTRFRESLGSAGAAYSEMPET